MLHLDLEEVGFEAAGLAVEAEEAFGVTVHMDLAEVLATMVGAVMDLGLGNLRLMHPLGLEDLTAILVGQREAIGSR